MKKRHSPFTNPSTPDFSAPACQGIPLADLERCIDDWVLDGELRQLSPRTLASRRWRCGRLLEFLREKTYPDCGAREVRAFLAHLTARKDAGGARAISPSTVQTFFRTFHTLFEFAAEEGYLPASPMEAMRQPVARPDQIQPFTPDQVRALLAAARKSRYPRRDEAVLYFLLDTGARAEEACGVRMADADLRGRYCIVRGKGDKNRKLFLGRDATKALWAYLKAHPREGEGDSPLFSSKYGEPFTPNGLGQLVRRLGKAAGIEAVRCSPHTFRHTFAVEFLRAGGNVFSLKELLGHESLQMTMRYVAIAEADIENQHRQFSPADRLRKGKKR